MAELFTQLNWNDGEEGGTPITAARGPLRWENGIKAVDIALDNLGDQVAALIAVGTGVSPAGTSANRPAPSIGAQYFDTDLGYPIFGNGSGWVTAAGAAVAGAGGSNAPQNFQAVVQADNSIVMTWDAPAGIDGDDTYILFETESPSGVSGATALSSTTTTRTPSTSRTYEYWVAADIDGVRTAISNRVRVSLPFGSTPGGGGGTGSGNTLAEILNINGIGTKVGGWWNLGIGFRPGDAEGSAHKDIEPPVLANGYTRPGYAAPNAGNTAVVLRVYMNGGKTSNRTKYPRTEFREYKNATTKASWNGLNGTHIMEGYTRVTHFAPNKQEVCCAQVHDGDNDRMQIRQEGGQLELKLNGDTTVVALGANAVGTEFRWKTELINGTHKCYINTTLKHTSTPGFGAGCYYKVGTYAQQNTDNGNSPDEYCETELRGLVVTHSPAL